MKKALSFLLVCLLIISSLGLTVQANPAENNVTYTLAGYGIIDANEDANMNEPVTRGEFAGMVTRLMCINESATQYTETTYWDVPASYKYASDVSILTAIGIFNGFSDTMFGPNEYVTYEQALKILVLVTGYGEIALKNGGWPKGYEYMATKNRMLGGVTLSNPFSRAQLYRLVYNTLDVELAGDVIKRGNVDTVKTRDTIRSQIADKTQYELYRHRGVIEADYYTYTTSPYSDLYEDEVVIENKTDGDTYIYNIGKTNANNFVGYEVDFYAKKTDTGYQLLSVRPSVNNEVIEVKAEELTSKNGNKIFYEIDGKHRELILDGSYKVVKNGSRIINPAANIFEITDGYISFIDNDGDHDFDLSLVWEYKNAIATSFDGRKIDFANDAQFRNLTSLAVDKDNRNVKIFVTDKDGNSIESFDTERTVSIFENSEKTRYRVIVSDEMLDGTISEIDENSCIIGEREFGLASSLVEYKLGKPYHFYIDYTGKLAFTKMPDGKNYGYIMEYEGGSLSRPVQVKMIIPGKVDNGYEINEEDGTVASDPSYLIMQNDSVLLMDFADRVRINGRTYDSDEIVDVIEENDIRAVSYNLDKDGKIVEMTSLVKHGGNIEKKYQYNVKEMVFGGTTIVQGSGFALDDKTVSACVPADDRNNIKYDASEDDLAVKIHISEANNDVGFRVEGYDFNPETKKVQFVLTFASMDATIVKNVDAFTSTPGIVVREYIVIDEETDDEVKKFEILQRGSVVELTAMPVNEANKAIERVKKGDLVVFSTNNNGLLSNVSIIQSLPDIMGKKYYEHISGLNRKSLGKVGKIEFNEVDSFNKCIVTKFELFTDESGGYREITAKQKTGAPVVYLYDSNTRTYSPSSLFEIIPESDKIFMFERDSDYLVKTIVIIR